MNKIAILDYGSQFTHLLANRIRRLGVYSEILDPQTDPENLKGYAGLILSGGPASVNAPDSLKLNPAILNLNLPLLGVCYGHQLLLSHLGGKVEKGSAGEYGLVKLTVTNPQHHLKKLKAQSYDIYASHFDAVTQLPEGFVSLAHTPEDPHSVTANPGRKIYTLQFHPEVTHTSCGMDILDAFLELTGVTRDWNMEKFIQMEIDAITQKVGDKKVFLLVSGGVDSSVAYVLLAKALGPDRIYALYVDTGFMRKNETQEIEASLKTAGIQNLHVYQGGDEFFSALKDVTDPEQKRKIIGDKFLDIQRKVASELQLNPEEWLLGQGTIYPDTIESGGTQNADKIKTHHNRVPEIEELLRQGKIIEPLKELYKDEVRSVGRKLGLPAEMVDRQPFPGPGLAVRCLCLQKEDGVFRPQFVDGPYAAHVLPIKSVGVQGDERTYRHPAVLEGPHNWAQLRELAPMLTNQHPDINRVLFTVALKNGPKIETVSVTPGTLTPARIATLQEADHLVMTWLKTLPEAAEVWQFPTVLLPLSINSEAQESIVLRPVSSMEAMTANFTELPWPAVEALAQNLLQIPTISAVFYDLTNKPPGTIEWE